MNSPTREAIHSVILPAILIAAAPLFFPPIFVMKVLCFALFASAFNLLLGYVGMMSFGHAAFFGMGAYTTAWVARTYGVPPELCILLGGAVGMVLGAVFGAIAIRRQGLYFAMITLALAQMIYFLCVQAPMTGGEDGLHGIPRGSLFGVFPLDADMSLYPVIAVLFLVGFALVNRIIESPFGEVLRAIRENEPRTISLGYDTRRYKWIVFTLSATIAGFAGGMKAILLGLVTLTDVHFALSGEVVLMTLIGGVGTLWGPVIGAAILVSMSQFLAPYGAWVMVVNGAVFVFSVLVFRRGVAGTTSDLAARIFAKPTSPVATDRT